MNFEEIEEVFVDNEFAVVTGWYFAVELDLPGEPEIGVVAVVFALEGFEDLLVDSETGDDVFEEFVPEG